MSEKKKALAVAKSAIKEVMADFPPMAHWTYAADAVAFHLGEAGIYHQPLHDVEDDYSDTRPGLIAVCDSFDIYWDGESVSGVSLKDTESIWSC